MKPKMCSVIWWCVYGWTLWRLITECQCRSCFVCLRCLQTVGFVLNVGQQNPSYVKGRQAGRCKKRAAGGCAAVTMEEAVAHIRLPEHCWRWTGRDADRKSRPPMMKTVLSLHRKWAHAVKTIRILQGLVSVTLLPWLRFDQICGRQLDLTGSVIDLSVSEMDWVELTQWYIIVEKLRCYLCFWILEVEFHLVLNDGIFF